MKRLWKIIKWPLYILITIAALSVAVFFLYCNSLRQIDPLTITYYEQLKRELKTQGYKDNLLVISSKRARWHNKLLTPFGASSTSRHLKGDAIDIMVLDVNGDGTSNLTDVDIVYQLLDHSIVRNTGGLGTYKSEPWIWNRQMVHLDCRKKKTRWHR